MAKEKKKVLVDVREIGAKGGRNSRKNLDPAVRTELAKRAAEARWGKAGAGKEDGTKKVVGKKTKATK